MSEFTLDELQDGEIVPGQGGPKTWLVRFGDQDYRLVNKTPKHRLLLETDVLSSANDPDTRTVQDGDETKHVTFIADVENDRYRLTVNGRPVSVPSEHEDDVLNAYADEDFSWLLNIHQEIVSNRVRVGLLDRFMPRFDEARDEGRLVKGEDGWVIDDTFIVQWDGENYLAEDVEQHVVQGDTTVRADESRQARVLNFDNLSDEMEVDAPDGQEMTITRREAKFLATVECLLNPEEYLTDDEARDVHRLTEWSDDPIAATARTASVESFTDEKSGLVHLHSVSKHTLDQLGVTDAAVERLFYNSFDHAGAHEMKAREEEFRNATFDVFEDAPNNDARKWEKIESTSRKAPIPQQVRDDINSRF
jgi:hypothetical protein